MQKDYYYIISRTRSEDIPQYYVCPADAEEEQRRIFRYANKLRTIQPRGTKESHSSRYVLDLSLFSFYYRADCYWHARTSLEDAILDADFDDFATYNMFIDALKKTICSDGKRR